MSLFLYTTWQQIPERQRNGIIVGYLIILNNTKFGFVDNRTILTNQTTSNGNGRSIIVVNLKYFSSYQVSLSAFTVAGAGPYSFKKSIETLESGEELFTKHSKFILLNYFRESRSL